MQEVSPATPRDSVWPCSWMWNQRDVSCLAKSSFNFLREWKGELSTEFIHIDWWIFSVPSPPRPNLLKTPSFPLEIPSWDGFLFELPFADSSGATQRPPGARIEKLCKFKWMQIGRCPVHTFELPLTESLGQESTLAVDGREGLRKHGSALWCYLFTEILLK